MLLIYVWNSTIMRNEYNLSTCNKILRHANEQYVSGNEIYLENNIKTN